MNGIFQLLSWSVDIIPSAERVIRVRATLRMPFQTITKQVAFAEGVVVINCTDLAHKIHGHLLASFDKN
jgi:hypothetical protein